MRILDCFTYFNEKELLELRINLLYDYVDQFIIIDADRIHSGKPKPFTCKNTLKELGLLKDKIKIVELNLPSYEEEPNAWIRERMQRNEISKFIENDDVCIISDCDEIINPEFIKYYTTIAIKNPNNILRIPMVFLNCRADLRVYDQNNKPIEWNTPFICLKNHVNDYTLSEIRESHALRLNNIKYSDIFITEDDIIAEAGWHFSWMGDYQRMKMKCDSYSHHHEVKVTENYVASVGSVDPLGRKDHILQSYPKELLPSKIFESSKLQNFFI